MQAGWRSLLANLDGVQRIMGELMYATGARIIELVRLRVKDIDFDRHQITIREGKGKKDRSAHFRRSWQATSGSRLNASRPCTSKTAPRATRA